MTDEAKPEQDDGKAWQTLPIGPPPIMEWFHYEHLPVGDVRNMSHKFRTLATWVEIHTVPGPERSTALRKLLEAKDAAVRSVVKPGG